MDYIFYMGFVEYTKSHKGSIKYYSLVRVEFEMKIFRLEFFSWQCNKDKIAFLYHQNALKIHYPEFTVYSVTKNVAQCSYNLLKVNCIGNYLFSLPKHELEYIFLPRYIFSNTVPLQRRSIAFSICSIHNQFFIPIHFKKCKI